MQFETNIEPDLCELVELEHYCFWYFSKEQLLDPETSFVFLDRYELVKRRVENRIVENTQTWSTSWKQHKEDEI